MLKFIFMFLLLIPLSFTGMFWVAQFFFFFFFITFFCSFSFDYNFVSLSMGLGCDLISFLMIMLSIWICSLMIMASEKLNFTSNYKEFFIFLMIILLLSLFMSFGSLNLFYFYLFFESSLIPTLILIVGWGYQPERIQAGVYLIFYTMLASLPMMVMIFYLYNNLHSLSYFFMDNLNLNIYSYLCMNMVFFIKIPMYFVHLWLPKAHVEAPVSGSMILAGIMLKLGGYGLMRLLLIFISLNFCLNYFFMLLGLFGGMVVSFICLRQLDMKSLIAYSSVAHMSLVMGGILSLTVWGFCGSLCLMVAHGLCSSGLFCLANITYERTGSRSLYLNKGLINFMPSFSLMWFLLISSNMASPPSLNLMGEIMLINSLVSWDFLVMLVLIFLSFFSAAYSLYLYSYTQHGEVSLNLYSFSSGNIREYLLIIHHWLPLNLLFMKGELL
uniref:NADH-ubiquinone oxidoreductase chain 4 n=1 Tax=Heterocerus parallelus TaxID=1587350 RepID=A0A343C1I5_9COLE|nr:NADH dehydrogenase subunit 4 [Heterocerus parallelus]